jgi:hypothetical protein
MIEKGSQAELLESLFYCRRARSGFKASWLLSGPRQRVPGKEALTYTCPCRRAGFRHSSLGFVILDRDGRRRLHIGLVRLITPVKKARKYPYIENIEETTTTQSIARPAV